ncbi:MAG: hypothetical protein ACLR79_10560 [Waltera sp.]
MKNPKNTVWRIALFLLTVVCGLLMADRGENEFPVFACSEALSGESGSTGLLLQQNMWEVVPLLGYGIVEQQGTQNPEEDETTCRTPDHRRSDQRRTSPSAAGGNAADGPYPGECGGDSRDCIEQFSSGGTTGAD